LVNSLLTAIVRADGDALVMHVGERPYVVASSGPVELSSRPLTLDAVTGMLGQLLPFDARRALEELGAVEHELSGSAAAHGDRFTVVAARGGDDIWIEVRRHRRPQAVPPPVVAAAEPAPIASVPEPVEVAEAPPLGEPPTLVPAHAAAPAPEPAAPVVPATPEPEPVVDPPPPVELPAVFPALAVAETVAAAEPGPIEEPVVVVVPEPMVVVEPVSVEEPVTEPEPVLEPVTEPEPVLAPLAELEPAHEPAAEPEPELESAAVVAPVILAPETPPVEPEPEVPVSEPAVPVELPPAAVDVPVTPAAPVAQEAARPVLVVGAEPSFEAVSLAPASVPLPEPEVMSFEALVEASMRAAAEAAAPPAPAPPRSAVPSPPPALAAVRPAVPESIVRPLSAAPIVERLSVESILFDEPVYPAPERDAAPVSLRPVAAVTPESAPAVVLPLARNPVRMDTQTRTLPPPRIAGIDRLLRLSAARGANTLYLMAQARPSVRVDGEIAVLEGEPALSAHEVESLLLDLAPENSREALQAGEGTEWMSDVPDVGRVRCQSFRDHRGPGGIFRMIAGRPTAADQLGLAREIQALCAESEGLILVAGPRASGKSTLVSSLVDLVNRTRNDYVITVESQIKFVHESRGCLVSQREVRGGNDELAVAVRAALRENPDVLVIEDMRSTEVVRLGLEAMEAGLLVIGGVSAHGAAAAIAKVLGRAPMRLALAEGLRGVVSQVLLRKNSGGRVAAREVLLNIPTVANLIAEGRLNQLPMAIDAGRKHGMVPLNDALAAFVQSGVVDVKEAYRKAFERQAFLAVLRREGVDTSFVERLA
jgi:twitching motility protein PilT